MINSDKDSENHQPLLESMGSIFSPPNIEKGKASTELVSPPDVEEQLTEEQLLSIIDEDEDDYEKTIANVMLVITIILISIIAIGFCAVCVGGPILDDVEETDIISIEATDVTPTGKTDAAAAEMMCKVHIETTYKVGQLNLKKIKNDPECSALPEEETNNIIKGIKMAEMAKMDNVDLDDPIQNFLKSFTNTAGAPDTVVDQKNNEEITAALWDEFHGYWQICGSTEKLIIRVQDQKGNYSDNDTEREKRDTPTDIQVVREDGTGKLIEVSKIIVDIHGAHLVMGGWKKEIESDDDFWHHEEYGFVEIERLPRRKNWLWQASSFGQDVEYQLEDGSWKSGTVTDIQYQRYTEVDNWVRTNIREAIGSVEKNKFAKLQGYWKYTDLRGTAEFIFEVRQDAVITENPQEKLKGHITKIEKIDIVEGNFVTNGFKQSIGAKDNKWHRDDEIVTWVRIEDSEFTKSDSFKIDERVEYRRIWDGKWMQGNVTSFKPFEVNNWQRLEVRKIEVNEKTTYKIGESVLYTEWEESRDRESSLRSGKIIKTLSLKVDGEYGETIPIIIRKYTADELKHYEFHEPPKLAVILVYGIYIGIWVLVCIYFRSYTVFGTQAIRHPLMGVYTTLLTHAGIYIFCVFVTFMYEGCCCKIGCGPVVMESAKKFIAIPYMILLHIWSMIFDS